MASNYKKTAKDIAFDRERAKLRKQIYDLQQRILEEEHEAARLLNMIDQLNKSVSRLMDENQELRELLNLPEEDLQILVEKEKRHAEAAENIKTMIRLSSYPPAY